MKRSVENDLLETIRRLEKRLARQEETIAELQATIAAKDKRIEKLETEIAKLKKNSSTSSKPPSSDIVKPPKGGKSNGKNRRKKGGQPGHPKYERPAFPQEEINEFHDYKLEVCPDCGGDLERTEDVPRTIQQVEVEDKPIRIDEYRAFVYWCDKCQKKHYAKIPPEIEKGGLVGPRLTAVIAYLKGACHASFSTIRKYVRDVLRIKISRSQLSKIVQKVNRALADSYNELLEQLRSQKKLNVDETGHKDNGDKYWTWCFRAEAFVFFKIAGSRSSDILFELLGKEFEGILGCDYFSAYRKYMKDCSILVQFCLAHLIRDIRYLTTLRSPATVAYGHRLLQGMRELFSLFHNPLIANYPNLLKEGLERKREEIIAMALEDVPGTKEAKNLANRFRKHGKAYFQFITTPGIDPTNNIAEQAIRFVVIDRLVTQGTRSERGRQWCERIWTVIATCAQQGRSAFEFIFDAVDAYFNDQPSPSLLPAPT
jgi:transposase